MSRSVRLAFLALTLVLCIFANGVPTFADTVVGHLCGPDLGACEVDQDCVAYCQPCGTTGTCVLWQFRSIDSFKACRCN
jgi:hypothetical protein